MRRIVPYAIPVCFSNETMMLCKNVDFLSEREYNYFTRG